MIAKQIANYKFILGSKSPRRQELLKKLIPEFKTIAKPVEEKYDPDLKKMKYLESLKTKKKHLTC